MSIKQSVQVSAETSNNPKTKLGFVSSEDEVFLQEMQLLITLNNLCKI